MIPGGGGAHAFNPNTQVEEAGRSEFVASLVYGVNSWIAKTTQRNFVSKTKNFEDVFFASGVSFV